MEINVIEPEIEIEVVIKCKPHELEHIAKGLKNADFDSDEDDDCDCGESSCYDCHGFGNYQQFKKLIMEKAGIPKQRLKTVKKSKN